MALALGRTVAELEHSISHAELHEWAEYSRLEPFIADRNEVQIAQLSCMVAAFMGEKVELTDFMLSVEKQKKVKSKESALLMKVKALFGGAK